MTTAHAIAAGWALLAALNFAVQMLYFFNDSSPRYFRLKKATTPLLLFSGAAIAVFASSPLAAVILGVMGVGELWIEGSAVVEAGGDTSSAPATVTIAAILFLLVNVALGSVLLWRTGSAATAVILLAVATALYGGITALLFATLVRDATLRSQILLYGVSLVVLLAGVIADRRAGGSSLGMAALLLTISDTLVLIRMGAQFDKARPAGKVILLALLVVILLIYYAYMAVLVWGL